MSRQTVRTSWLRLVGCAVVLLALLPATASAAMQVTVTSASAKQPPSPYGTIHFTVTGATPDTGINVGVFSDPTNCPSPQGDRVSSSVRTDASGNVSGQALGPAEGHKFILMLTDNAVSPPDAFVSECKTVGPYVPPAVIKFGDTSIPTVPENARAVTMTIVRSGTMDTEVKFTVVLNLLSKRVTDPFGTVPGDFGAGPLTGTIPAGAASVNVQWPLVNDTVAEVDEVFGANLTTEGNAIAEQPYDNFQAIIADDDRPTPDGGSGGGGGGGGSTAVAPASKLSALKKVKARKSITIAGTATGSAVGVDVAIVQFNKNKSACKYVKASGKLGTASRIKTLTACRDKGFVAAKLSADGKSFKRTVAKGLAKGTYTVFSRGRSPVETAISTKAGNQRTLTIK